MSLANCPRCGKVYPHIEGARELCPTCVQNEEKDYRDVFKFLSSRPSASAQEIADGTGVDIKEIFRFLRENRLRIVRVESELNCDSCGTPILFGKFCENCQLRLKEELKKDLDKIKQVKTNKTKTNSKYSIQRDNNQSKITRRKK